MLYASLAQKNIEDGVYRIMTNRGHGSGFKVAEPGIVVTNNHVIEGAKQIHVAYMDEGKARSVGARIVWFSSDKDLAILRTDEALPGSVVELADIDTAELAKTEAVTAIGFPGIADRVAMEMEQGLLDQSSSEHTFLDPTVSSGTIQRLVPTIQRLVIQHSANINSGNSGGPLFDACNRVIGVNTMGTISTVGAADILNAITGSGRMKIDDPGDLEFAVHVREVLLGLREKNIHASVTPGRCRASLDVYELSAVGSSAVLAFAAILLAGFHWRNMGGFPIATSSLQDPGTELFANIADVVPQAISYRLIESRSGISHSLDSFDDEMNSSGVVLGRPGGGAHVIINDASTSRRHARIRWHGDDLVIHDEGSTNGTKVDGKSVTQAKGQLIKDGSIISLGGVDIAVERVVRGAAQSSLASGKRKWLLSGFDLQGATIQHEIVEIAPAQEAGLNVICTVGRGAECDIVINDDSVSRKQAQIGMDRNAQLAIIDLGSSNGTLVDHLAVGNTPVPIATAKRITFGRTELAISLQS